MPLLIYYLQKPTGLGKLSMGIAGRRLAGIVDSRGWRSTENARRQNLPKAVCSSESDTESTLLPIDRDYREELLCRKNLRLKIVQISI